MWILGWKPDRLILWFNTPAMKVVVQTPTHLKLKHYPWGTWTSAIAISLIVPVLALSKGLPKSGLGFIFLLFVGSVIAAAVIIQMTGQISTCDFYKSLKVVTLKYRSLLGVRVVERALQNVLSVQVIEDIYYRKGWRRKRYSICLNMHSGESFDLTTNRLSGLSDRSLACHTAEVISKFLNVPYSFVPGMDRGAWRLF